jgi:hypothetical protein
MTISVIGASKLVSTAARSAYFVLFLFSERHFFDVQKIQLNRS